MIKNYTLILVAIVLACGASDVRDSKNSSVHFEAQVVGLIRDQRISEISGMALSTRRNDVLWVINDSGDDATIYAINVKGDLLAAVSVPDAENIDWEDLASFQLKNESFLLIADVGNNVVQRDLFSLYLVKEPSLQENVAQLVRRIDFYYSDGPRDCEAVTFDRESKKILLLSKRDTPVVLYELPLDNSADHILTALRRGDVTSIPQPTSDEIKRHLDKFHAQPTAIDLLPDGSRLAVLTYRRLFIYDRRPVEPFIETLNSPMAQIEFPVLEQAEAMCFDAEKNSILITTEKLPATILRIKILAE